METYSILREFADSWWLLAMFAFFVGQILWTLRPWAAEKHRDIANIPLRNDDLGPADTRDRDRTEDPAGKATESLTAEEQTK